MNPGDWFLTFSHANVALRRCTAGHQHIMHIDGNGVLVEFDAGLVLRDRHSLRDIEHVPITQDQADACLAFVSLICGNDYDTREARWFAFAKGLQDGER